MAEGQPGSMVNELPPRKFFDNHFMRYGGYQAISVHELNDGLVVMPLAKPADAPGPHFLIIRRHAPVGIKQVSFRATKTGTPPIYPAIGDTPSGDVLLAARVGVAHPEGNAGTEERAWAVEGEYRYVQAGDVVSPGQPNLLQARENISRGARRVGGQRMQPTYHTGRPPFIRFASDAASLIRQGVGLIPFFGPLVEVIISTIIDPFLDAFMRSKADPNLIDHGYIEPAVDVRPNYSSTGMIR